MAGFELVLTAEDGGEQRVDIGPKGVVIGRSPESDILLADALVSRQHARVSLDSEGVLVEDMGSRNGILVRGQKTRRAALLDGDEFCVGPYRFTVQSFSPLDDTSSMITYEKADDLYQSIINDDKGGRLPLLFKAAQLLGTVFDLDELFNRVLQIIFEALRPRRAFILTMDNASKEPFVRASLFQDSRGKDMPISKTLVRHVLNERAAVLTTNAQEDVRFDGAASLVGGGIKGAMCVPLYGRDDILGAIYVDAMDGSGGYSNNDLEVLTAIGKVVGVAFDNARMHKESLEKERLVAIGEATAGLGHCVKNILAGMKGGSELVELALGSKDMNRVEKAWPLVQRGLDRIETLMLNLLTYSRERTPELMATDLNDVMNEVLETVRMRAQQENVEFVFTKGEIGPVYTDGREIYRVFLNLVTNAIEACEGRKGKVMIETRRSQGGCEVVVADNGAGIPPEIKARLSQAFVSTKGSRGTGLGLACSYKIVKEHGGSITVESEPGKGARFCVQFPAHTAITSRG
jgi:two-component system NtrC family sensor kinase